MFETLDETLDGANWGGFIQAVLSDQLKFRNELKLNEKKNGDAVKTSYGTEGQRAGGGGVSLSSINPAWIIGGAAVVVLLVLMARR